MGTNQTLNKVSSNFFGSDRGRVSLYDELDQYGRVLIQDLKPCMQGDASLLRKLHSAGLKTEDIYNFATDIDNFASNCVGYTVLECRKCGSLRPSSQVVCQCKEQESNELPEGGLHLVEFVFFFWNLTPVRGLIPPMKFDPAREDIVELLK